MTIKEKDRVFVYSYGWGIVAGVENEHRNIIIKFNGHANSKVIQYEFVSFTPYDLVNGGFSQERPKPELKEGQILFAKPINGDWVIGEFAGVDDHGYAGLKFKSGAIRYYVIISILNPYPDSIETKAIELLREITGRKPAEHTAHELNSMAIELLKEIDSYEK
jgi:hypothetical protein